MSVDLSLEKAPEKPRTAFIGQVVGKSGPVRGATVKILDRMNRPVAHTETDSHGKFAFVNVVTPGLYTVIATSEGCRVSSDYKVTLETGRPLSIVIRLEQSSLTGFGTVYGDCYDEANRKLPDVILRICDAESEHEEAVTQSNDDGEYIVYGLKQNRYWITAAKAGYRLPQKLPVDIYPNEITRVNLFLYPDACTADGTISGKLDHKGTPAAHAVAAFSTADANDNELIGLKEANDSGLYLFSEVKPGKYVVKAKLEEIEKPYHVT